MGGGGWSSRLARKPPRKRYARIEKPEYGMFEAALANLVSEYTGDQELVRETMNRLRDQYGVGRVNVWLRIISRIYREAEFDWRMAFVISQRPSWQIDVKSLFRQAFRNHLKEFEDLDETLVVFNRYYVDDVRNRRIRRSEQRIRELFPKEAPRWINALARIYEQADLDYEKAFAISQRSYWRLPVTDLFRRTFPDIAAKYDAARKK